MSKLVTREKKVAFMGCTKELTTTFHRMKHFTSMSRSSNPNEYSRMDLINIRKIRYMKKLLELLMEKK